MNEKTTFTAAIIGLILSSNIFSQQKETKVMSDSTTVAIIKTNMGTIEIELFEKQTPKTNEIQTLNNINEQTNATSCIL